ncbi:MAG: D-aminoacyl-tRNA deacylase [Marinilabiliaceae bacterium]|nr:D-aminoacyl-tRNA deacylase [Bacteroidales bacterium]MDD5815481.1 D-aminoacyl-tRNA deacylase [Bacteroidales bacterium]MDY4521338.1 D-aminoacyl-tRNA deacylase [Bacteroidales bacterium]
MRAVLQRVTHASVVANGVPTGAIGPGLMILLGVEVADGPEVSMADVLWLAQKVAQMRIFSDEEGLMNRSVQDIDGNILVVSQFTLFAKTKKGNRPSFIDAARPDVAVPYYEAFVRELENILGRKVPTGVFGADMQIDMQADGPVTIIIDTRDRQ